MVEHSATYARVLVREAVVLLPPESRRFNIVERRNVTAPVCLEADLEELRNVNQHVMRRIQDWRTLAYCSIMVPTIPKKLPSQHSVIPIPGYARLVRWEDTVTTSQDVTLQEPLESVLREHLDHATANVGRLGIPLEVAV